MQAIFDELFLDQVTLAPELTAKEVPEWDSLMQINILVAIEQHFKVRFRMGEVETTSNIGEFADLIARRLGEAE
jgi:acyl carrier protein